MRVKIEVWQLDDNNKEINNCIFRSYDDVKKKLPNLKTNYKKYYKKVYEKEGLSGDIPILILEALFEELNIDIPEDYKGRSLSVSDIVVLNDNAYYCNNFGWTQL